HTPDAPWFIVPGDRKPQARAVVAALMAEQLQHLAPEYPKEDQEILNEYRRLLARNGVK
ncbi:MAG: polyphosphate kinase, partial [Marinobacter sp.]|nr:polyphosphate kinase [Marinobacter sp.]